MLEVKFQKNIGGGSEMNKKERKKLKKTTIQIDEEVLRELRKRKRVGERDDYNKVLRRLFGLNEEEKGV